MENIKGKTAIITGASGGMGREISYSLAQHGVNLVLASRNVEDLREVAQQIKKLNGHSVVCPTDVSSSEDVSKMVGTALEKFGTVDFLICTAGVGIFGPVENLKESDWDTMMEVNLKGPFLCCKAVIPILKKQKSGHIINIASLAGTVGSANLAAYGASKSGLIRFSDALGKELRNDGIKVSTISPGSTNTGFGRSEKEEKSWKMMPADIAEMVYNMLVSRSNLLVSEVHMRPLKTSL